MKKIEDLMKEALEKNKEIFSKFAERQTEFGKEIDPPTYIAKKLDSIYSDLYAPSTGVLASQMIRHFGDLPKLINPGNWFYFRPSQYYYYLGDHRANKIWIVESKNSLLAFKKGTAVRAEPFFYSKLSDRYKPYFLPIQTEYEKDGYKVYQMPLVEIISNSPNNLDEFYKQFPEVKQIPEHIIKAVQKSELTFNFGKAGNKIYIASYEGHEDITLYEGHKDIAS